jgi:flagellar L-ring protein precursor FlgH
MTTVRKLVLCLALPGLFGFVEASRAESLWEKRNPHFAYMFKDTRARRVGDVLTIAVREVTLFDGKEDRKMNKDTKASAFFDFKGKGQGATGTAKSFAANLDGTVTSQRELNGKADYKSDRTFSDRMSVVIVDVMPNGNLLIEGFRKRVVVNEEKVLRVTGIIRPQDIGADNIVQSQYIANFQVMYHGVGPETSYTNNGWLGRFVNKVWPF